MGSDRPLPLKYILPIAQYQSHLKSVQKTLESLAMSWKEANET